MRRFTTGEVTRIKGAVTSPFGDDSGLGFTAVVKRVTSGDDATARTTVVSALKCGPMRSLDEKEKERAGMANVKMAYRTRAEYNANVIRRHRLIFDGKDYRIEHVRPFPSNNPFHMYLFLADEGVAA